MLFHANNVRRAYLPRSTTTYKTESKLMRMKRHFGARIRELREERGISQSALGKVVGVSRASVSQWEDWTTKELKGANLQALANYFGANPDWILDETLPKYIKKPETPEDSMLDSLRADGWQADYCTGRPPLTARVGAQEVTYRPDIRAERDGKVLYFDIKSVNLLAGPLHRALAAQRPDLIQLPPESAANAAFFAEQRLDEMRRLHEERAEYLPEGAIPLPVKRPRVPVVGAAQLGDEGYWAELDHPVGHGDGYIDFHTTDQNAYALRCKGDSMAPRIKDGEFVVVEPNAAPHPGDEVMVKAEDGRVMIKELLYVREGLIHLASVNEAHGRITIPITQVAAMHLVAGIAKRVRWHPDLP